MSVNLNALATQAVSISPRNTANDKRGLVYDYLSADYAKMFVGSKSSFGSNWHGTRDETGPTLPTSFNFIPTLTVDKNLKNDQWIDTTQSIIKGGAKFVFAKYEDINGFIFILRSNEPDHPQQANLTPSQAAQVYQKYMMPLKGLGASIATPAVTNGGAPMGLTYL
ncbi:hypothetical protein MMC31_007535, partial [Peltigera leucophlebia]|nr:hypothetical protein [Peltigera leucophlebia]